MIVNIGDIKIGKDQPMVLISGPCAIENDDHPLFMAESISEICNELNIPYIFKASWDKANRTALQNFRGVDIERSIKIFERIKKEVGCPITTDIHESYQADLLKGVVDLIQIPAFLCRQTDLLLSAGNTGCGVNVKKAQFVEGDDMIKVVDKIKSTGNKNILLTERGNTYGYGSYVVDFTNIIKMRKISPVIFDATHSVQQGSKGGSCGSFREYIEPLARAGVAVGVDGLFMEVHDRPEEALSDGTSSIRLSNLKNILTRLVKIGETL
tara:strand:- start:3320 stop:4123 length:804 start_codon:yes stop_codon:yes gene_type:complete